MIAFALDVLILKRGVKRAARFSVPLLLWCIPLVLVARAFQHPNFLHVPSYLKPMLAIQILSFYMMKLVSPLPLVPVYALTPQILLSGGMLHLHWIGACIAIVVAIALYRKWPELGIGLIVFAAGVLPVMGFVEFSFEPQSAVADHYVYLSMLGIAIAITFGLARIQSIRWARIGAVAGCAMAIVSCAVMSFRQTDRWRDSLTLFRYNLEIVPDSWTAHSQLGSAYIEKAMWPQALDESYKALGNTPEISQYILYQHIGRCLVEMGQNEAAITALEKAVELQSDNDLSRTDLAIAYSRAGRHGDAVKELKILAQKHPNDPRIRNTLRAEEADLQNQTP